MNEPRTDEDKLRSALEQIEALQVHDGDEDDDDKHSRGLILSYNDETSEVAIVDKQLLLYRRYMTVKWPWDSLSRKAEIVGSEPYDA